MVKRTAIIFTFIGIFLLSIIFVLDVLGLNHLQDYLFYWSYPFLLLATELCGGLHTAGLLTTSLCDYFIPILLLLGFIFCHTILGMVIGYTVMKIKQRNIKKI